jgi:hypothetical protein
MMIGLLYSRFIVCVEPIASLSADELIRVYAPPLATVLGAVPVRR